MPDFGFSAASLQSSDKFAPYSKVVLKTDEYDTSQVQTFTAGNDSGRTLEAVMPMASQEIANSILESIRGYAYQPITAKGVIIDPATELGDDITVGGVSGYVENQDITFGGILRADIAAPGEEQIDHEYQYIVKRDRKVARGFGAVGAAIKKNVETIKLLDGRVVTVERDVAGIAARVTNAEAALELKAEKTTVQELDGRVSSVETAAAELTARVTDAESALRLKAEKSAVEAIDGRLMTVETAAAELTARVTDTESGLKLKAEKTTVQEIDGKVTTLQTATANLNATIYDEDTGLAAVNAGLDLKAEKSTVTELDGRVSSVESATAALSTSVSGVSAALELKAEKETVAELNGRVTTVETATANLSARVGDAEASLILKASQNSVDGLSKSVATLSADVVELQGRVDLTGSLSVSGGNVYASGDITALTGTIVANTIAASSEFLIGGTQYVPTQITSTTGARTALGHT